MNEKELENKINGVVLGVVILIILIGVIVWMQHSELQRQIDENKCVMGGSCPEINSILPDRISEVLDRDGLTLSCKEYKQEEVLRWNITCNITGTDFYMTPYFYIQSKLSETKDDCGYYQMLKREAIIIKIDGDCLKYEIVKK